MGESDYYAHRSKGFVDDYFGEIGEPVKISAARYTWMRASGFRVTKVPEGTELKSVMIKALIDDGTDLNSHKAKEILKNF